jgi:tetratricopeptide (TPR) repeat protein
LFIRDWFNRNNRVSFVPMKISVQQVFVSCAAALLLSACTSNAQRASERDQPVPVETIDEQAPQAKSDLNREPIDEEVMYRVFAAEYLGSEGDLKNAVGEYLEAALKSEDPEIARRATQVAYAAKAWQQAAMASDRWALLAPTSVAAHESAAVAMLLIGDYMGAEFQILEILNLMGDSTEAWLLVSSLLSQAGSPEQADAMLEQILETRGTVDSAEVLFARSHLAVRSKDLRRAFELARQAVELNPERIEFLTWAGRLALNLKLVETGLEYIRRSWQLDPENHDLALAYADLLARNGHESEARTVMKEMQQAPDVMLSRILFELAAKDRAAAERLYAKFEEMDFPDQQEKIFYQAQSAEALGLKQQAIELYSEVESGDRAMASVIRIAELRALDGDIPAARRELARLREQTSPAIVEESWLAEARILREAGLKNESFQVLAEAMNDMPKSIPILYTHALLAAELGRVDIAEKDLRVVIAKQPENAAALNALGYTLADQTERYEEAQALIQQAYILQPEEASIIDSMGWVAFRLGRLQEAVEFLKKAWLMTKNPEIAAHLGEVLWVGGNRERAMAVWGEGHDIDSQNAVLVETLERLGVNL